MRIQSMLMAAVLAVPGFAAAQAQSPDYPMGQQQQQQERDQSQQHQTRSSAQTQQQSAEHQQALQQFRNEDNYEIEGTISSVDQQNLTITREQLPGVQLVVPEGAEVKLDGNEVDFQQLQPGQEIRATFNVAENTPLAVELDAKLSKEEKEMQKQQERQNRQDESSPW